MMRVFFLGVLFLLLFISLFALAQDSTKTFRAETFYFKTTGTLKPLLSESAYQAVVGAAKASGYSEDEIEVTIIVTERKKRFEEPKPKPSYTPSKPKPKKFE